MTWLSVRSICSPDCRVCMATKAREAQLACKASMEKSAAKITTLEHRWTHKAPLKHVALCKWVHKIRTRVVHCKGCPLQGNVLAFSFENSVASHSSPRQ